MTRSLARDSVRGAAWLFGTGYIGFAINFVVNLLIARLLYPEDYGVFALAFAAIELVGILSAFSIPLALIHLEDSEPHLFDTGAWMYLAVGGMNVAAAAIAVAVLVPGRFSSEAGRLLVVLALARVVSLMSQVSGAALEKVFRYGPLSVISLVSAGLPNLLSLLMAWQGFGPWSLAGREVLTALLSWLLLGCASSFRFRGRFHSGTAGKIWRYCSRMFISRGLQVVLERFDRLVVGKVAGVVVLGIYDRSRYISEMGGTLTRPVDGLSFNLYSRLRTEEQRLLRAFMALNFFLVRAMMGLSLLLLVYPREVVLVLLGPRWLSAAESLRWMALYAGLLPIYTNMNHLLYGRGMMRESNQVKLAQAGAFIPLFLCWVFVAGPASAGFVLFLAVLAGIALMVHYQRSFLAASFRELFLAPSVAFVLSVGGLLILDSRLPVATTVVGSAAVLLLASLLYGGLLLLAERGRFLEKLRFVFSQLQG